MRRQSSAFVRAAPFQRAQAPESHLGGARGRLWAHPEVQVQEGRAGLQILFPASSQATLLPVQIPHLGVRGVCAFISHPCVRCTGEEPGTDRCSVPLLCHAVSHTWLSYLF